MNNVLQQEIIVSAIHIGGDADAARQDDRGQYLRRADAAAPFFGVSAGAQEQFGDVEKTSDVEDPPQIDHPQQSLRPGDAR